MTTDRRSPHETGQGQDGAVIDVGGPVDPSLPPQPVDDVRWAAAFTLMAPGWYPPVHAITQSYGFCFTPDELVVWSGRTSLRWPGRPTPVAEPSPALGGLHRLLGAVRSVGLDLVDGRETRHSRSDRRGTATSSRSATTSQPA
jgi:hypothetical protein